MIEGRQHFKKKFLNNFDGVCEICGHLPDPIHAVFNNLIMAVDKDSRANNLQQLIDEYLTTFSQPFGFKCTNCNRQIDKNVVSKTEMVKLPKVLMIEVPKFGAYPCPTFVPNECVTINDTQYQLCGVLDHRGVSVHSGHWVTWAKHQQNWLLCNDHQIEGVQYLEMFGRNNYVLLFEQKQDLIIRLVMDIVKMDS